MTRTLNSFILQQQKAAPDSATESARTTSSAQDSVVIYTGHEVGPRLLQQDAAELPEEKADEAEASETHPVAKDARTPEELRDALAAGTQHIVIKSHLDLTVLEKVDDGLGNQLALAPLPTTVKSITVSLFSLVELGQALYQGPECVHLIGTCMSLA